MENAKKIHAINEVQRLLRLNALFILPQVEKYIGKKIYTQTGWSKNFKIDYLKEEPAKYNNEYANVHYINLEILGSSIYLRLSLCFKCDDHTCFYEKNSIFIGEFQRENFGHNGILNFVDFKTLDFVPLILEEQEAYVKEYKALEERLRVLKHKIVLPL
jgi:hypothetical protein